MPVALYRAVRTVGKRGSKPGRARRNSLTVPGLDLATKLRVFQRTFRSRVEKRDALLDVGPRRQHDTRAKQDRRAHRRTRRHVGAGTVLGRRRVRFVRPVVGAGESRVDTRHGTGRLAAWPGG